MPSLEEALAVRNAMVSAQDLRQPQNLDTQLLQESGLSKDVGLAMVELLQVLILISFLYYFNSSPPPPPPPSGCAASAGIGTEQGCWSLHGTAAAGTDIDINFKFVLHPPPPLFWTRSFCKNQD